MRDIQTENVQLQKLSRFARLYFVYIYIYIYIFIYLYVYAYLYVLSALDAAQVSKEHHCLGRFQVSTL